MLQVLRCYLKWKVLTPYLSCKGSRFQALASIEMHYFQLQDLVPEENVKQIDTIDGLVDATRDFVEAEDVGIDGMKILSKECKDI